MVSRGYGDKLTNRSAQRIQRDEDWKRSEKIKPTFKDPIVPRNPKWKHRPLEHPLTGRCAVILDEGAGYCGAPNGGNAFRFCEFHANLYINKLVRRR